MFHFVWLFSLLLESLDIPECTLLLFSIRLAISQSYDMASVMNHFDIIIEYFDIQIRFDHKYIILCAKSMIKTWNYSIFATDYEFTVILYPNIAYYSRIFSCYCVIFIIF